MSATLHDAGPSAPALRYVHSNGGGLKLFPAVASPDSRLDRGSSVEGESEVYASTLLRSAFRDTFADGADLFESVASGCRLTRTHVTSSDLQSTTVVGAEVVCSTLRDCRVHAERAFEPYLYGVTLEGVTVSGNVELVGPWELLAPGAHVHAGRWTHAPRSLLVSGGRIEMALLECTEGRAHFGCKCNSVPHWLERGPAVGRRLGWSEEQIELCRNFLNNLL